MNIADRMRAAPRVAAVMDAAREEPGVYLVGGAVRDLILEKQPLDVDLAVEGDAVAAARRMAERLGGEVRVHGRFGTATVTAGDRGGVDADLVRARVEHGLGVLGGADPAADRERHEHVVRGPS